MRIKPWVSENRKIINHKNPISGHEWTTHGDFINYELHEGFGSYNDKFKSLDKCMNAYALSLYYYHKHNGLLQNDISTITGSI